MTNYKGAFACEKCPKNGDPAEGRACPMWWVTTWTDPTSEEVKVLSSCGFTQLPLYLVEVIKSGNRAAASTDVMRTEVAEGMTNYGRSLFEAVRRLAGQQVAGPGAGEASRNLVEVHSRDTE